MNRMPMDTTRIIYLQHVYQRQQSADWTIQLSLSQRFENQGLELCVLSNIHSYYSFQDDLKARTTYCLSQLKAVYCKYKKDQCSNERISLDIARLYFETIRGSHMIDQRYNLKNQSAIVQSINH